MNIFDTVMEYIYKNDSLDRETHIPRSDVFYARAAIREATGVELHPYKVEKLLYEEGLLHAVEYGIPQWYVNKYMNNITVNTIPKKKKRKTKAEKLREQKEQFEKMVDNILEGKDINA